MMNPGKSWVRRLNRPIFVNASHRSRYTRNATHYYATGNTWLSFLFNHHSLRLVKSEWICDKVTLSRAAWLNLECRMWWYRAKFSNHWKVSIFLLSVCSLCQKPPRLRRNPWCLTWGTVERFGTLWRLKIRNSSCGKLAKLLARCGENSAIQSVKSTMMRMSMIRFVPEKMLLWETWIIFSEC